MVEQRSRLQLLDELRRLDQTHANAVRGSVSRLPAADALPGHLSLDGLFERYSYAELQVIADYLSSDIARLQAAAGVGSEVS
jgi:hypothetical protein